MARVNFPFCVSSRFLWPSRALKLKAVSDQRSALSLFSAVKYACPQSFLAMYDAARELCQQIGICIPRLRQ
jgi:hypothetical protein